MEVGSDKDYCSALGGLFQTVINDLRGSSVIWEDFTTKASKLHSSLKATLLAIGGFLDAFQKVADMATGSRGATKEIGSALTRLCMRHKSIEAKLKTLTSSILDSLVTPLQDRTEDWKKTVAQLDKEHAKEYKRARQEIKKAASDTMRLQKKVKKGKTDMQTKLDMAMQDVNKRYYLLEEEEKKAVRNTLIEERGRFCLFISCLKPFVDHELGLLTEITHLQEIMHSLCLQASEPQSLPQSSEQVIQDIKGSSDASNFFNSQHSPPSSPSSIGSRKSSMCSISSINSSSSGSSKSRSPSHKNRTSAQPAPMGTLRLQSVSSQDSGFTSQDTLFQRPATPTSLSLRSKALPLQDGEHAAEIDDNADADSTSSTPSDNTPSASSTWTNWPNPPNTNSKDDSTRPHTISSAYEKAHARIPLTAQLFKPPIHDLIETNEEEVVQRRVVKHEKSKSLSESDPYPRPVSATINKLQPVLPPLAPKPKSKAVPPPKVPTGEQPTYVNLSDLANMEAERQRDREQSTDSDQTPTEKSPPSEMSTEFSFQMDIEEAIRDLDNCTAALNTDYEPNSRRGVDKIKQNSLELAKAIEELEASTAALQSNYDSPSNNSQHSLQCSSGYGTMNSSPASSEDTIATGDYDFNTTTDYFPQHEKYFTIPRHSDIRNAYRAVFKRPASTAGLPVSQSGAPITRRSSMNTPKPPPPVRRSSSITTASPAVIQKLRKTPPRQIPEGQHSHRHSGKHRRSSSSGGMPEPAYAELQTIQQSILARQEQDGSCTRQDQKNYYVSSAPPTPSQYAVPVMTVYNQHNSQPAGQASHIVAQDLNSRYSASVPHQHSGFPPPPPLGVDPDLPPPPTDEELQEIEKVYSRPPPVNPKPSSGGQSGEQLRVSLISELKQGPKLRRVSSSDDHSEC